jgi:hypothetical protein
MHNASFIAQHHKRFPQKSFSWWQGKQRGHPRRACDVSSAVRLPHVAPSLVSRAESRTRDRENVYIYTHVYRPTMLRACDCCVSSRLFGPRVPLFPPRAAPLFVSISPPLPVVLLLLSGVRPVGGVVTTATPIVYETLKHVLKK